MTHDTPPQRPRWYHSFYWRLSLSFVAFVLVVITAQAALSTYFRPDPDRGPTNLGAIVAADLSSVLAENPSVDLAEYLRREYATVLNLIYVIMRDGRTASNRPEPLDEGIRESITALLHGANFRERGRQPSLGWEAMVTAPVQRRGELIGMVVLPPRAGTSFMRQIETLASPSGTAVLILATLLATPIVFGAARRRLIALEQAAQRLGTGDLSARAPEVGRDEIARLAVTFNRMADELAARDAALRASDTLRRQMLADVSHELRTPLTTMIGYLDTIQMSDFAADQSTRDRYLAVVTRETRRLDRLVRDLVDLARLEGGGAPLDIRLFAVERVFANVAARHEQEAAARNVAVRITIDDAVDQVTGDPDRLEQVMENLFANALRHTPDGGAVSLSASLKGNQAVLSVTDNGPGIAREHLPRVFERFYKADPSRVAAGGGSGLGLSIARAIVAAHGGTLNVDSRPGHTVFTVILPHSVEAAMSATGVGGPRSEHQSASPNL